MKNIVNLGNVATYINGYAFKPSDWAEDGTPIIRIQDLTGNSYQMNRFKGIVDSKYEVNNGDVLISWSASLGVYIWNRGDAVLNQHIFKVVFDKVELDKDFFVFQVDNLLKRAANQAHGATMRHLTKPVFDALPFYLPDIKTQRLISSKLSLIGHLIEDHHNQLKKFDELIRSRFIELFGDLKLNSKNWKIFSFPEFALIDTQMIHDFHNYEDYPHIGIDSIEKDTGNILAYRTIGEDHVISGKYLFTANHIIYSKIRPNLNKVALPDFDGLCSADAYPILPIEGKSNRYFLAFILRSNLFLSYILAFSNRTNLPKVNKAQIERFRCPLPPIEMQDRFAVFYKQVDKSKYGGAISLHLLEDVSHML